jgi:uncharacterized membrane protein
MSETASPRSSAADRPLMLALCYLYLFCLIPLLLRREDGEVAWHARNGLALSVAMTGAWLLFGLLAMTRLGCLFIALTLAATGIYVVLAVVCIVYALNGLRLFIPGITALGEKWR